MNERLNCELDLVDDKVRFNCSSGNRDSIFVDYYPPLGNGKGYTSLELLLISAASCVGTTLKAVLTGRHKKKISGMKVSASGLRKKEHPTILTSIDINLIVFSDDLEEEFLREISIYAIENICPVTNMLKSDIQVNVLSKVKNRQER